MRKQVEQQISLKITKKEKKRNNRRKTLRFSHILIKAKKINNKVMRWRCVALENWRYITASLWLVVFWAAAWSNERDTYGLCSNYSTLLLQSKHPWIIWDKYLWTLKYKPHTIFIYVKYCSFLFIQTIYKCKHHS